jgi:DNA-binding NarL/FixJ family response regulator
MSATISVLLVDDHAVVREGYKRLLERSGDIVVVGEAATSSEAYLLASKLEPHVVVMDIALPGASGIEGLRRIRVRQPDSRVLMFSMYSDAIFARRALEAGAIGYLTKASAPEALVEAVRAVARNEQYLSRDIQQALAAQTHNEEESVEELSPREFEVLRLWLKGQTLADIAQTLSLSQKTVANHQTAIKQKLRVDTQAQLWHTVKRLGLAPESADE